MERKNHMKRILSFLAALMLLFTCAQALAAEGEQMLFFRTSQSDPYSMLITIAGTPKRIYIVRQSSDTNDTAEFSVYDYASETVTPIESDLPMPYYTDLETVISLYGEDAAEKLITKLFTQGDRLLAYNALLGTINELTIDENGLTFAPVVTLDPTYLRTELDGYTSLSDVQRIIADDTHLYFAIRSYEEDNYQDTMKLLVFSLQDGTCEKAPIQYVTDIERYKDDRFLLRLHDE